MDDDVTTKRVSEVPVPDTMRTLNTWLWVSVAVAAFIAGIAGGIMHPSVDYQTGVESFGYDTFFGWSLLVLVAYAPIIVVFYAVKFAIDTRVKAPAAPDTADTADTAGEVAAADERS